MLITSGQQKEAEKLIKGQLCGACWAELRYPVIVAMDRNGTAYHANCALELANSILFDLGGFERPILQGELAGLELAFSPDKVRKP